MSIMKSAKLWLLSLATASLLAAPVSLVAQAAGQISGVITSATGQPLPGASVAAGTRTAQTGTDGRYTITGVPAGAHTVRANLIGYTEQTRQVTVAAGQTATANFELASQAVELEGIVAVGYGTQRKVNITGSVAAVEGVELEKRPVADVSEALQGAAPGLTVIDRGGRPGDAGTFFFIRGRGSLNSVQPLILVDGIPGDINALDASDIASISVLKDAASASIYGSRAAGGVILITTKRGTATGGIQMGYDGYYGIQGVVNFPKALGPREYLGLINEAYTNAGLAPKYSQERIEQHAKTASGAPDADPIRYPWTDWLGTLFNPAPIQDHTLSLRGGSDLAQFSLSVNYMDQEGMLPQTGADRYGVRLNTDFHPTDRLHTGVDLALRRESDIEPNQMGGVLFRMFHDTPPTVMAKYPDGTYGWSDNGHNPLAYAEAIGRRDRSYTHGLINAKADYQLLDGLTVRTLASVQTGSRDYKDWRNDITFQDYFNPNVVRKRYSPNQLWRTKATDVETYLRGLVEYTNSFGASDLTAMVGYDQTANDWEEIGANRAGFYNNELQEINVGDAGLDNNWGRSTQWRLRSGFGRLNYALLGKYLFEANARYDGSSRFGQGNRFGFFPSFSAGWRISEEPFMDRLGFVTDLKLRGSWGKMGNQSINLYEYVPLVSLSGHNYLFGDQMVTGAALTSLANPDISWETTTMTDIGVDAAFMDGRLSFTGDMYWKDTDGILLRLPIPSVIGLGAPRQNAGSVRNTGWESALDWRDFAGDVNYSAGFNVAYNKNEITDLAGTGPYVSGLWLTQEGFPLGTMYGWEANGLFQNQAEVDAHARQHPWTGPGDIRFVDQNGDGKINNDDKVAMGTDMPKYTLGSTLSAAWKGLDASVFFQGALDVDAYLEGALVEGPYWENFTTSEWLDRWTPENPNGRMPRPALRRWHNHQRNSYWVRDASYVKLKNAQLGFTIPESLSQRFSTNSLRLYVSGQNIFTFSNDAMVLDPEFPAGRGTVYPQTRTISFGVNAQF